MKHLHAVLMAERQKEGVGHWKGWKRGEGGGGRGVAKRRENGGLNRDGWKESGIIIVMTESRRVTSRVNTSTPR